MQKARAPVVVGSLVVWWLIGVVTVVFSLLIMVGSLVVWIVDPKRMSLHWLASGWGRAVFLCNPFWRVTVNGRHHLHPHHAYILVSNHQSLFDIMALFSVNRHFKWVAKDSLFRIPLMGWAMSCVHYIKLERGRHGSIRDTYAQAKRWLEEGVSVFFFPEGTRSRTGELGPFKNGAFKLALETGIPVVPIAISGTRDLLERGGWMLRFRTHVHISLFPALEPATYGPNDADRLRDDARNFIQQTLSRHAPLR